MSSIGFSTGALCKDALAEAIDASDQMHLEAIELSALRLRELAGLVDYVNAHDLSRFKYVSVHAPTDYTADQEPEVADALLKVATTFHWPVVVHPDCFRNTTSWKPFGKWLCIENMDKRKTCGRTVEELRPLFDEYPEARLCFDIAHAHQVDTSMTEAYRILREFGTRIVQLHVSEVTSGSRHDRISEGALRAFQEVAEQLPRTAPIILETPVLVSEAQAEIEKASRIFTAALLETTR